jgi:hypothetical protein
LSMLHNTVVEQDGPCGIVKSGLLKRERQMVFFI